MDSFTLVTSLEAKLTELETIKQAAKDFIKAVNRQKKPAALPALEYENLRSLILPKETKQNEKN